MKMKPEVNGQKMMTEPTGFNQLEKRYDLSIVPDEKIDGKNAWVIKAKLKKGQAQTGEFERMVMYYDQTTGMLIKTISYDKNGKVAATMEVVKSAVNVKISDDRFKVPAGVQVTDMSKGMPRMPMPTDEDEQTEE